MDQRALRRRFLEERKSKNFLNVCMRWKYMNQQTFEHGLMNLDRSAFDGSR